MIVLNKKPKPKGSLGMQKLAQMKFGLDKHKDRIVKQKNQQYIFDYEQFNKENK